MAILFVVSISIITTVFAQREETVPSIYTDDELSYTDPSDKFVHQRSMSDRNFLRLGRGDMQPLPDNYDNEYDELVEDTRRPTRTSNGNFLRFGRTGSSFLRFGRGGSNFLRFGRNGSNNFLRFGRNKDDSMRVRGNQKEQKMSDDEVKMIMRQIRMGRSVKADESGARKKRAVASKPSRNSDSFLRLGRNNGERMDQDDVFDDAPIDHLERLKQNSDLPIVQLLTELICKMDRDNSKCTRLG